MKEQKSYVIALFIFGCIAVNCAGKGIAEALELPIWLDTGGTVLAACFLGPVCGAMVGASVNIIYGFFHPFVYVYALTSVAIGVLVGVCARQNRFQYLFGTLTACFLVSIASVSISAPLNYIFFAGYTGNKWGDGVIDFLQEKGCSAGVSYVAGQYYMDFLDKTFIFFCVYVCIRAYHGIRGKKKTHLPGALAFCAVCGTMCFPVAVSAGQKAAAEDYNTYIQTAYNAGNGLMGGIATDIGQTNDGVLWIGTYNGLYRYSGKKFQLMDTFESVKNVNCLYTDDEGRLWVGTNDNGLSVCIHGEVTNVLDAQSGMPSNAVRCIAGGNDGNYYVGTTDSLAVVTLSSGISIVKLLPEISYADSIAVNKDGQAAAVTNDGRLYLIRGTDIAAQKQCAGAGTGYTCCMFDVKGRLYAGTADNRIEIYAVTADGMERTKTVACSGLSNIKEIKAAEDGTVFVCADNDVGYFDRAGSYHRLNTNGFNSSIDHMLTDYQGNLWFTSSRLGLLKLSKSAFTDLYDKLGIKPNVVNAVTAWKGAIYFGTDSGLDMADAQLLTKKESRLTKMLAGIRIRHLMVDSKNRLWIATSGRGVWVVSAAGDVTVYDSSAGTLGDKFRMALELSDRTVLLAGDAGITVIKDGKITGTIGKENGLYNPKTLCMQEMPDGRVLAGTDGNGIAVIKDGRVQKHIGRGDGLSAGVILRICEDAGGRGYFLVTSSGLCYMDADGKVKRLAGFPYNNNFDVIQGDNDKLFVLSSAGIFVVERAKLLQGKKQEYMLLDSKKGLRDSLTPNAWTYRDKEDYLYLPGSGGVTQISLKDYDMSMRSYRMKLKTIWIDGAEYPLGRDRQIQIQKGAKRLELVPEVINYTANDPYVSVYLAGVDTKPQVMRQSELSGVVYTNIPAGEYTLRIAVFDKKERLLSESRYHVLKEYEMYEHGWFFFYFIFVLVLTTVYLVWMLFRTQIQRTLNIQKRELAIAKKQIQMGNEAIITIARTVDAKDPNTSKHSLRVSEYAVMIAQKIGYDEKACEELRKTALLHDIGKIGIPDSILNKPARLSDEEYGIMKSHVAKGAEILKNFTSVDNIVEGALYHHERYDGHGYVHGLKGGEIPLNARIIGIADAFDAMTANRVYRKKLDIRLVLEELEKGKGTQFDPGLVDVMLQLVKSGEICVEELYGEKAE